MTKFEVGKKYYYIFPSYETIKIPCRVCKGEGFITLEIDGTNQTVTYTCPECKGSGGEFKNTPTKYQICTKKQKLTSIHIDGDGPVYYFSGNGYREPFIFSLKKEAQAEIDKLNAELESKEVK